MTAWATDKVDLGYLPTYERLARELGDAYAPTVLEIGVANGGGLDFLAHVFKTNDVYGVDISPDAGLERQRKSIVTCAQEDPGLAMVLASNGWAPFDLIVDDASHQAGPTAVTLANLWQLVRPGGFYVIDDWNIFDGPGNASNLWQKLLGGFLAFPVGANPNPRHPYSGVLPDVDSVLIRNGQIVIQRAQ